MSESGNDFNNRFKEALKDFAFKAKVKYWDLSRRVSYVRHELGYGLRVSNEQTQTAEGHLGIFAGEVLGFLKENPAEILRPVSPTEKQMKAVRLLLLRAGENDVTLNERHEMVTPTKRPYLAYNYEARDEAEGGSYRDRKKTFYTILWDINGDLPIKFTIEGLDPFSCGALDFIAIDKKAEMKEDVDGILGEGVTGVKTMIDIYNEGKRIDVNKEFKVGGEQYQKLDKYFLLGVMEGEESKKNYWIYGSNSETNQKLTKMVHQNDAASDLITQGV